MNSRQRWTLILTAVASLMAGLDTLVVTTAMNMIRLHLHASIGELDWIINAYTLTIAVFLLTAAAASDRLGRRRVLVAGIALFTAASAGCALAPSIGVLITARAVQGVGTAIVLPAALALVSQAFPPEHRGKALGLFSGITGLAILSGPVIGGAVVQGLAWQWIFWLNVPIGIILVPLILRQVAEGFGPRAPFDAGGLTWSGLGALGLIWGLIRGNAAGWAPFGVPPAGWRRGRPRHLRRVGTARAGPDGADGLVPQPGVRRRQRGRHPDDGLDLRRRVLLRPVPAGGPGEGPLAAGLRMLPWTATLFLVAPAKARSSTASASGCWWWWAWPPRPPDSPGWPRPPATATRRWSPPWCSPGSASPRRCPPCRPRPSAGAPVRDREGVRRLQRDAPARRRPRDRDTVRRVHRDGGFTSAAAIGHGFRAAMIVATAVSAAGALAGAGLTRRRPAAPARPAPDDLPAPASAQSLCEAVTSPRAPRVPAWRRPGRAARRLPRKCWRPRLVMAFAGPGLAGGRRRRWRLSRWRRPRQGERTGSWWRRSGPGRRARSRARWRSWWPPRSAPTGRSAGRSTGRGQQADQDEVRPAGRVGGGNRRAQRDAELPQRLALHPGSRDSCRRPSRLAVAAPGAGLAGQASSSTPPAAVMAAGTTAAGARTPPCVTVRASAATNARYPPMIAAPGTRPSPPPR